MVIDSATAQQIITSAKIIADNSSANSAWHGIIEASIALISAVAGFLFRHRIGMK